ncbi:MAG TPA: hypothetical protein VLL04_03275, partial [Rhizomicrobium sp.]|nr:hypothetical protein [Rhizomicrobium sp.]
MTKRRFKLSLAALGLLMAFFLALIGLLLAPSLASANKDFGDSHPHGGKSDNAVSHGGPGGDSNGSILADNWGPGHGHGDAIDTIFCTNGVYPCTEPGGTRDEHDGAGGPAGGSGDNYAGGSHNHDGDGSSNGNSGYPSIFWGGGNGGAGGNGGGAGG